MRGFKQLRGIAILLSIILSSSCTYHYVLTDANEVEFFQTLDDELNDKDVQVTLLEGDEFSVLYRGFYPEDDSEFVILKDKQTGLEQAFPAEMIKSLLPQC
jgi:hypothetical protein